jgi:colanic acid biosynthesis glycosyl transferase WcaI
VPASHCRAIEKWADGEKLRPKATADSVLRRRLGLADKFVIGYSGNLGRAHEFETVLGAAERLRSDDGIAFLFIGAGAKMDELKASAVRRHMTNFHFLPYQPRESLEDSLAAADVHLVTLIPSLEGLIVPSKFYGILAAGRPVVFIGDVDGELSRTIRASHCGVVVASGNSTELFDAIKSLERDTDVRTNMGLAARELMCSRFAARRALDSWAQLLTEIRFKTRTPG